MSPVKFVFRDLSPFANERWLTWKILNIKNSNFTEANVQSSELAADPAENESVKNEGEQSVDAEVVCELEPSTGDTTSHLWRWQHGEDMEAAGQVISSECPLNCPNAETDGLCSGPYVCCNCGFRTVQPSLLRVHILRTHAEERPFICDLCHFTCRRPNDLKRHLEIHSGEKSYSCNFCNYSCNEYNDLKKHLLNHTDETAIRPFSCSLCDFRSRQSTDLSRHMRIHTGEKPYSCDSCDYACKVSSDLKKHMSIHSGEKPYGCHLCDYRCRNASDLRKHIRKHTGEKPYECHICKYKSSDSRNFKRHMKSMHNMQ